jgi:hypothetical protein
VLAHLIPLAQAVPEDEDVVAGPIGALVFVFLVLAVAVIGWALTRSLRTAQRAKDAGVYGPVDTDDDDDGADHADTSTGDGGSNGGGGSD